MIDNIIVVNIQGKLYLMLGKIIGYTISYIPARVFPLLTLNTDLNESALFFIVFALCVF